MSSRRTVGVGELLILAWPIVIARSTQAVIGFADALMTADLGADAMAAATTGAMNVFNLIILPMGVVYIVQSFAAQLHGQGDLVGARRYGWYALIFTGLVSVLSLVGIPLVGPVLGLFDFAPSVRTYMAEYMVIRMWAIGAAVGTEALGNWYGGLGNTRMQMIAGVIAMVTNVALNWVLIFGNLGAPAMGVAGAAWASVISTWLGFAFLAAAFLGQWGTEAARERAVLRLSELWRMLRFGAPNGVNWFFEFAAFSLFINAVIGSLGTLPHAACMAVISLNSVAFMPAFGLSSAGAILVGQAIGRKDHDEVPFIWRRTVAVTAVWQCGVGMFYLLMPRPLVGFFAPPSENAEAFMEIGAILLIISGAWQLFDAVGITLSEALRAAGDTAWCMWARLALSWLFFMPAGLLVVNVLGGGTVAAMLCICVYVILLSGLLGWRFYSGAWRKIDLTGSDAAVH